MFNHLKSLRAGHLVLTNGSIEALKWIALIAMTIDHVNQFLFELQMPLMYALGRIAMPLFGFVLAYNLARPNAFERGIHIRTMRKLFLFGVLAAPFFIVLKGPIPFNIMFTLLLATYLIYLIEKGGNKNYILCALVFMLGGMFVDYAWCAPAYCLAAWWYCKTPVLSRGLVWLGMTVLLWLCNLNYWACAALPIIFMAQYFKLEIPRLRYVFYAYYPAHLAALLLIQKLWPVKQVLIYS